MIERAEISHLEVRFDAPRGGSGVRQVDLIVADLADADGAVGLGFTYVIGGNGAIIAAIAEALAERFLRGQRLPPPEALWRTVHASFNRTGGGPNLVALAALDVAAWDLAARRANLPLGAAMGGAARPVPTYGSGDFAPTSSPEQAAEIARRHLEAGFKGVKPRVGATLADDAVIAAVSAAVAGRAHVMVDANEKGDLERARRLLAVAAAHGLLFVEEPLPAHDVAGYRALRDAPGAAVAAGEHLQGADRFVTALSERHVAVIQPDLAMAGGLTPCLQVARLAEPLGIGCAPHFLPGLFVHLAAAAPAVRWLEDFPLVEEVFTGWPRMAANGTYTMPDTPGHGLSIPPETRARYRA